MSGGPAQLGRVAAYLGRLRLVGILEGCRIGGAVRAHGGRATDVTLIWDLPDTSQPGETWRAEVPVRLPDGGSDADWDQRLLEQVADRLAHELGEAVQRDGKGIADPHTRPRIWPWRAKDREGSS